MYYCDQQEINAIEKVLKSKKLFRYQGAGIETECSLFEKDFATYLDTSSTILLSSGTNALVNALFTCGISEGDEVLVPAYTFYATLAAIIELKAKPVVINVDDSLSFDLDDLKTKITDHTKAIIVVHMDGYSADMDSLKQIAEINQLILIEDVAQAVGGSYKGQKLGTFGSMGCFSFNVDKIISCGEGGAVSINDKNLFQKAFMYHDTCNQFGSTYKNFYDIEKFSGKSMRASEIQGAMMNVQLQRLDTIIQDLKIRYNLMNDKLKSSGFSPIKIFDENGNCFTTFRIKCTDANQVSKFVLALNEIGIDSSSPVLRPAHSVWSWFQLYSKHSKFTKFDYLPSMEILSKTLLMRIGLEESLEEWNTKLNRAADILLNQ